MDVLNRRNVIYLLLALAILSLAAAGYQLYRTAKLASDLRDAASLMQTAAASGADGIDPAEMAELMRQARLDASALHTRVQFLAPLLRALRFVPRYGPLLSSSPPLTDYGLALTTAGDELLTGFSPLWMDRPSSANGADPLTARFLVTLEVARPNIAAAQQALAAATAAREEFTVQDLPESLRDPILRLDPLLEKAERGLEALDLLPALLGAESPQRYLLLAQNEDELRASGGFISAVGTLVIEGGEIRQFDLQDSYDVDDLSQPYPEPPEPLQRYMRAGIWLTRDANWSPDFPTAASRAMELYRFYDPSPLDGAIAFDQAAVEGVLSAIGPVTPPDAPGAISAENVRAYMQQAWAPAPGEGLSPEWWERRKDFIPALGTAILGAVQDSQDREALIELAKTGLDLLERKHLLLHLEDPQAAQILAAQGWDGALQPGPADLVMLVDTNMGFNKVDPLIRRRIDYSVDLRQPDSPTGSLSITYEHTLMSDAPCVHQASYGEGTYASLQQRCYWDFLRLYLPSGVNLIDGTLPATPGEYLLSGEDEPGEWSLAPGIKGTAVLSGIFVLPPSHATRLEASYSLPANVLLQGPRDSRVYLLRLVKQPGTDGVPVTVSLYPPPDLEIVEADSWQRSADGSLRWQGPLTTDYELMVRFGPAAID